ncbi:3-oxoacyl-[acyl-carrier protein] reductase [Fictibacillus enclensis]|uniref:Short-chain dehydrogenase n=1 Tax=Fictibacillus enclensis TaxID=1017270 RepID=A0A0V8JEK3_9BACL|nr:SDR family oxidoreductase [Fictibacillus enclensis]KSU85370.1 short-chain dehydrogenase [Fictibacillus enclensis]SCB95663.1 3-oxoacyl-[acyl-carrier protein] reductase [Fictibacillus enclensis]
MKFGGSIALVTGAGSGIGRAAAIKLAEGGATVLLVGRTVSKLEAAASEISKISGAQKPEISSADVTKEEDVEKLAEYVKTRFGDLHILVNNAGGSSQTSILNTPVIEWDYVQSANLKSVFLVSRILGKVMIKGVKTENEHKANRAIVNIASLSGHQAGAHIPHYSAAKAGVINFTRALALELSPYSIRVNSVSPGFIETPLTEEGLENEQFVKAIEKNTALRRIGKPEEIANIISFLASSEASYMTGSDVLADGGWLIK